MMVKLGKHKVEQYYKIAKLLKIKIPQDVVLDYQNNKGGGHKCALSLIVACMCEVLESNIPKVAIEGKILKIEFCDYQRALTLLLAYFQDYLSDGGLNSLKESLEVHLNYVKNLLKPLEKVSSLSVGITMIGYTKDNKHIGNIDENIVFPLVYCCNSFKAYELAKDRIKENFAMISHPMYYVTFPKLKVLLSVNTPLPLVKLETCKTIIVHLGHNFNEALQYTLHRTDESFVLNSLKKERMDRSHYVVAHTLNDFKLLFKAQSFFNLKTETIKGGCPSLDWALNRTKNKSLNSYLLFAPSYLSNFISDDFVKSLNAILESGVKVVCRLHPNLREYEKQQFYKEIKNWCLHKNFIFDETSSYLNSYINNSFALLTDESSMGVSYPLTYLKPAIIYMPNKRKFGVEVLDGIHLYSKEANLIIDNFDNLKDIVGDIKSFKVFKFEEQIRKFREKQVYNIRHSSEYLSEFINNLCKEQ
ncbi:hypothetical protein [Helicobacter winghamensis]|uniref:hypothetical protein n=2 Tax=Helicobacter winghamensis TaxID=157268 RepID=UPI0018A3AFF5|nr:hypothetical protein [Helicobacter winghamensis]QOQ97863.1 hypothetical protein A0Z60_07500 [Helicobacter winghamensis]